MKLVGIALIALGIIALTYGGFGYSQEKTLIDVGGLKATTTEHKSLPVAPIGGVLALIGGIALIVADKRRA